MFRVEFVGSRNNYIRALPLPVDLTLADEISCQFITNILGRYAVISTISLGV